mmetsp:Transcript_4629/g.14942  ORF Transcript_4629/g.14942 Transcript_4629/m.14942 type:complete len:201 (+) Transcript_4629:487-1089(+)
MHAARLDEPAKLMLLDLRCRVRVGRAEHLNGPDGRQHNSTLQTGRTSSIASVAYPNFWYFVPASPSQLLINSSNKSRAPRSPFPNASRACKVLSAPMLTSSTRFACCLSSASEGLSGSSAVDRSRARALNQTSGAFGGWPRELTSAITSAARQRLSSRTPRCCAATKSRSRPSSSPCGGGLSSLSAASFSHSTTSARPWR